MGARGWSAALAWWHFYRRIFRRSFEAAGLRTLQTSFMSRRRCKTPIELKAWSQNLLGHDDVLTTNQL